MVVKAQTIINARKVKAVSQRTLDSKKFRVSAKGEKVKCEFCNGKVVDIMRHLQKCHRNPSNSPKIEVDWDYIEQYREIEPYLIKSPRTEKAKEYNQLLAPNGNPFEEFDEEMLNYATSLPKAHKDKMVSHKFDEIFTSGIELRLLSKEEFIAKLKDKVRRGYYLRLFDPLKRTTIEEIERNKDILWQDQGQNQTKSVYKKQKRTTKRV